MCARARVCVCVWYTVTSLLPSHVHSRSFGNVLGNCISNKSYLKFVNRTLSGVSKLALPFKEETALYSGSHFKLSLLSM